ncbi:MAG: hypothetical protein EOP45_19375, partial [Sphingobacteriaceae bacterium]
VHVKHTHKGSPFTKSTGAEVEPRYFDLKTGKVSKHLSNAPELNKAIVQVYSDIETARRNIIKSGGIPNKPTLSAEYNSILKGRANTKESAPRILDELQETLQSLRADLVKAEDEVIKIKKAIVEYEIINDEYTGKLVTTLLTNYPADKGLTKSASRTYKNVSSSINIYNSTLKVEELTPSILVDFEKHLVGKGKANSTIKTYVTCLKSVYRKYADELSLNPSILDRHKLQSKQLKEKHIIFLTKEEMQALAALECKTKSVESVRDLMLLMCHTGLRYSDSFITKDNIKGNYIIITTKKTNTLVKIPLSPIAKQILEKWNYNMPRYVISYFQRIIKELCARIPIMANEVEEIVTLSGKVKSSKYQRRCDIVAAHTGRKTFTTHALSAGVNPAVLKGWLGHSEMEM